MRMPWTPSKSEPGPPAAPAQGDFFDAKAAPAGEPLLASIELLDEDPGNPRTEFPEGELAELAEDIGVRGILQPIVVHRPDPDGRYRVRFGAKRLRAARLAGLREVPVVIGLQIHDAYAQIAENQKRHALSPLDLARFMRSRVDAGESNAEIAKRMGIDLTTVAHHLALLTLPPVLDDVLKSGRCTSPRTLYELSKLHEERPDDVQAIAGGESALTRTAVAALRTEHVTTTGAVRKRAGTPRGKASLVDQANDLCTRLESVLAQISRRGDGAAEDLAILRRRLIDLAGK